jgi:hypothetical protein
MSTGLSRHDQAARIAPSSANGSRRGCADGTRRAFERLLAPPLPVRDNGTRPNSREALLKIHEPKSDESPQIVKVSDVVKATKK